jgi:hypothetical protein
VKDKGLGYAAHPGARVRSVRKAGGKTVYDAVYSIDRYGRRITPAASGIRDGYLVYFGCSTLFGEGVNDDETLPAYMARLLPGYVHYNCGFPGYGTHQMLALLESDAFRPGIPGDHGAAFYFFIDSHISRAIGSLTSVSWGADTPCYELDRSGAPVLQGTFKTAHPVKGFFYRILNRSGIMHGRDFPKIRESHLRLVCSIIAKSRDEYRKKFDSDRFYVVFYPGSSYAPAMIPYLRREGIRYLDYSGRHDLNGEDYHIPADGHPNPRFYRSMAELLAGDAGLNDRGSRQRKNGLR